MGLYLQLGLGWESVRVELKKALLVEVDVRGVKE